MPNFKNSRMAEDIKREITAIIRELKDPRINATMLTVVRTELAADLSYGKVFVSSLEGMQAAKTAVKGLEAASGFIRRELSARLYIRKAPELKFIADDSVSRSIEMFKKLEKADSEKTGDDGNED